MSIHFEQDDSLREELRSAGVGFGDSVDVTLVTGCRSENVGLHLAFCSSKVRVEKVHHKGWFFMRWFKQRGRIVFVDAPEIAAGAADHQGFICLRARVTTSWRTISIRIEPDSTQLVPVGLRQQSLLANIHGKPHAEKILATAI